MYKLSIIIVSLVLGAASWAILLLFPVSIELLGIDLDLLIAQFLIAAFTVYIGWTTNTINVIISVVGICIGQNAYVYISGMYHEIWNPITLITSIVLCVFPLLAGLVSRGTNVFLQYQTKSI